MSTRSFIGILIPDMKVKYVYCHHDGYLSNNGKILTQHYNDEKKAEELVSLGDMSSLGDTIKECEFYHRDREEPFEDVAPAICDLSEYLCKNDVPYLYLFRDGKWHVKDRGFNEITPEMIKEDK